MTTSDSDAQDVPSGVASQAAAYSDTRVKQLPVKGLGVGDILEWRTRTTRTAAEIPGQFWLGYNFFRPESYSLKRCALPCQATNL